jgi:hypothetical protein
VDSEYIGECTRRSGSLGLMIYTTNRNDEMIVGNTELEAETAYSYC